MIGEALVVGIISATVSLIGIFVSAKNNRDTMSHKLDTNQKLINAEVQHVKTDMSELKADMKSHNRYAQLFNENIPVIKEKLHAGEKRMDGLEHDIRELRQAVDDK